MDQACIFSVAAAAISEFNRGWADEDDLLPIGKRKPKDQAKPVKRKAGGCRWSGLVNLGVPCPLIDAVPSADGRISLHFGFTKLSKGAVPTFEGRALWPSNRGAARANAEYNERDGAPERAESEGFAVYVEDDAKAEGVGPALTLRDFEAPLYTQTSPLGHAGPLKDVRVSIFSNISDDAKVRQRFWEAVHRCERKARKNSLCFDPERDPEWWREMDPLIDVEFKLRRHMVSVQRAFLRHESNPDSKKKRFRARSLKVTAEEGGRMIVALGRLPGRPDEELATFRPGPTGRVQYRIVASLPHEVSPSDRADLALQLCGLLPDGVMYTCVVHAPDSHNDRRNYHAHLIFYDRPCRYLPEHGCWDFEYSEPSRDSRHPGRPRYLKRAPKIPQIGQRVEGVEGSGQDLISHLRRRWASCLNRRLKEKGIRKRYDPRSLKDRGLSETPTRALGSNIVAQERAGVPTPEGSHNGRILWARFEKAKLAEVDRWAGRIAKVLKEATAVLEARVDLGSSARDLAKLWSEMDRVRGQVQREMEELANFRIAEAMARSRAIRVQTTCNLYLVQIEQGKATKKVRADEAAIRARLAAAEAWLRAVDEALAPLRDEIAAKENALEAVKAELGRKQFDLQIKTKALKDALIAPGVVETPAPAAARAAAGATERSARTAAGRRLDNAQHEAGPADLEDEGRIMALVSLISRSHRGESYVTVKDGRPVSAIAHEGLEEALRKYAEEPRVVGAVGQLREHLTICADVNALLETEAPFLPTLSVQDVAAIRESVTGFPRTLFASREEGGGPCLCASDEPLAQVLDRLTAAPAATAFIDELHQLVMRLGEAPLRGCMIKLPPPPWHGRGGHNPSQGL
ncbi:MAG: MobA/MobL family protein [Methyloceanibacter sp.]|nr:MobA/MobL family protein [Methyloceanibacter sp.]